MMGDDVINSNFDKSNRTIFVFIIFIITVVVLSSIASAQQYESGWDKIETEVDVNFSSAESTENGLWVFGDSGTIGNSWDNGLSWIFQIVGVWNFKKSDSNSEQIVISTSEGEVLIIGQNFLTSSVFNHTASIPFNLFACVPVSYTHLTLPTICSV